MGFQFSFSGLEIQRAQILLAPKVKRKTKKNVEQENGTAVTESAIVEGEGIAFDLEGEEDEMDEQTSPRLALLSLICSNYEKLQDELELQASEMVNFALTVTELASYYCHSAAKRKEILRKAIQLYGECQRAEAKGETFYYSWAVALSQLARLEEPSRSWELLVQVREKYLYAITHAGEGKKTPSADSYNNLGLSCHEILVRQGEAGGPEPEPEPSDPDRESGEIKGLGGRLTKRLLVEEMVGAFISSIKACPTHHRAIFNLGTCLYQHGAHLSRTESESAEREVENSEETLREFCAQLTLIAHCMEPQVQQYKTSFSVLKGFLPTGGTFVGKSKMKYLDGLHGVKEVMCVLNSEELSIFRANHDGDDTKGKIVEVDYKSIKRICLAQEQSLLSENTEAKEKSIWISTGTAKAVASGLWLIFDCKTKAELWCLVLLLLSNLRKHKPKACSILKAAIEL